MRHAAKDIAGQKFGRLRAISRAGSAPYGGARWSCLCDCGNAVLVGGIQLRNGSTQSCGCLCLERSVAANIKHGAARGGVISPEYSSWRAMKSRCTIEKSASYKRYGARGISFEPRWAAFENFLADMGPRPPRNDA